jgi:hypothetical protein
LLALVVGKGTAHRTEENRDQNPVRPKIGRLANMSHRGQVRCRSVLMYHGNMR